MSTETNKDLSDLQSELSVSIHSKAASLRRKLYELPEESRLQMQTLLESLESEFLDYEELMSEAHDSVCEDAQLLKAQRDFLHGFIVKMIGFVSENDIECMESFGYEYYRLLKEGAIGGEKYKYNPISA